MLKGFKRKGKYNEAVKDLENHFHLSYREVNAVLHLIAEAVVEIVNFKLRKCPNRPNKCRENQKLFWSHRYLS